MTRAKHPSEAELPEGDTHLSYTISPRAETLIRLRTLPNAVCRIRLDDRDERTRAVIASPAGYLDLYSTSTAEGETRRITVEAEGAKKSAEHVINVRCAQSPTSDAPSPTVAPWPSSPDDIVLPALSEEEHRDLDRAELTARGYPSRPNADAAPDAYRTWRQLVSRPLTVVAPSHVPNPDFPHRPKIVIDERRTTPTDAGVGADPGIIHPQDVLNGTSLNWCGGELRYTDGRNFDEVEGMWTVPNVSLNDAASGSADVAIWVGLDGSGADPGELLQGGTLHSVTKNEGHTVVTHQAWSEFLPKQPSLVVMNNLPIAPGNQIECTVAVVDRSNAPSHNGVNGLIDVINLATEKMQRALTPLGGILIAGRNAEWIFERVTSGKQFSWLASFANLTITQAYATPSDLSQPNLPWYTPSTTGVSSVLDTMLNSANATLAYPILVDNTKVGAGWKQSH